MMVRSYLDWSLSATAQERAEAVGILADVYLDGELEACDRRKAEAALMLALDDGAPQVRRMLAHKLGGSERAPRAVIAALAEDLPDIAAVVIANSPVLADATLVDLVALGGGMTQIAIAQRAVVSPAVAAALAEVASAEAAIALVQNDGAEVALASLNRMVERFPEHGGLREALLERGDLPLDVRITLARSAADHLSAFAKGCGWLTAPRAERLAAECAESAAVTVAAEADGDSVITVVRRLRIAGQLTPQLLLRSLLSGDARLLTATLADLAGVSHAKASGFVHGKGGMGFRALYRKAGLPQRLEPAFEAALSAWHEFGMAGQHAGKLSSRMVERVLTSVATLEAPEFDKLMALLMRYHAEAAREDARNTVAEIMAEDAPDVEIEDEDLEKRLQEALQIELQRAA